MRTNSDYPLREGQTIQSEPEHSGVNVRVLKALDGVVLLATLEKPGDGEAELTVLGAEIGLGDVTDRGDGDGLVGELVIVEREQALGSEPPVLPVVGQGQVRHLLQPLPVQTVQHLSAIGLTVGKRPAAPDGGCVQIDREEPVAESPARSGLLYGLTICGDINSKAQPLPRQIGHDHIHTSLGIMMSVPRLKVPRPAILHERIVKEAAGAVVVDIRLNDQSPRNIIGIYQPRLIAGAVVNIGTPPAVEVLHNQDPVAGHLLNVGHHRLRVKPQTQYIPLVQPIREQQRRGESESGEPVITGLHIVLGTEAHTVRERSVAGGIFPVKPLPPGPDLRDTASRKVAPQEPERPPYTQR